MRRSFLAPIPELEVAANLLSQAVEALLRKDIPTCTDLIRLADIRALRDFSYLICGPINHEIHRQCKNPIYERISKEKMPRMPSKKVEYEVHRRDGWRCRYCSSRVISKIARTKIIEAVPEVARWGRTNEEKHFSLCTLSASLDHVVPFKRGGDNSDYNLVTACGPCQFGRNQWLLSEVGIYDPRDFSPIIDAWDGLTRLHLAYVSYTE